MKLLISVASATFFLFALATPLAFATAPAATYTKDLTIANAGTKLSSAAVAGGSLAYTDSKTAGPAVVLLHGWPQDHREWLQVAPALTAQYRVVVIDLPGVGQSQPWTGGYSKAQMAEALHELLKQRGIQQAALVGHDIGGMIAHAYARKYPKETTKLVIVDVPLPGVSPWENIKTDTRAWHFSFFQDPVADTLISGHQRVFFKSFYDRLSLNKATLDEAQFDGYSKAYRTSKQLAAGLGHFRAFPQDESDMKTLATTPLEMPILYVGGSGSMGPFLGYAEKGLRETGAMNIDTLQIEGAGHWVVDEQPNAFIGGLQSFLRK